MSLAFSARLARREVRRRPGRTALVVALIMVPFTAIGIGSIMTRTSELDRAERLALGSGRADLEIPVSDMVGSKAFTPGKWIADVLGPDADWTMVGSAWSALTAAYDEVPAGNESRTVTLESMDITDPVNAGSVELVEGVRAQSADEIVVSANLAKLWNLSVGSTLRLATPKSTLEVVGIARKAIDIRGNQMWPTGDNPLFRSFAVSYRVIRVDLPGVVAGNVPKEFRDRIMQAATGAVPGSSTTDIERSFWSSANSNLQSYSTFVPAIDALGIFAVLAFAVLAVVVSAAFATSARRQLTTVGQLSANGASEREVGRSLALQGLWSGLLAVALGAIPVVWFAVSGEGIAERFTSHLVPRMDVSAATLVWVAVVAVVSSTVAAWVPSRSAARISVLDALAGRRPQKVAPRVYAGLGVVMFAAGIGLEVLAAAGMRNSGGGSSSGMTAFFYAGVFGGLAVLGSVILLGPVLVRSFDVVGARSSGAVRLAARGLARNRSRSSAVVVSIAAFGALGASVSTGYLFSYDPAQVWFPNNMLVDIQRTCPDALESMLDCQLADNPAAMSKSVDRIIGDGAVSTPMRWATFAPAKPLNPSNTDGYGYVTRPMHVASEPLLDAMGIRKDDRVALDKHGIIRLMTRKEAVDNGVGVSGDGSMTAVVNTAKGRLEFPSAFLQDRMKWPVEDEFMVTAEFARTNGFSVASAGRLVVAPHALSENQIAKLGTLVASYQPWNYGGQPYTMFDDDGAGLQTPAEYDPTRPGGVRPDNRVVYNMSRPPMDPRTMQTIIAVSIFALVVFVVTVGLALMAAEGKDERDVLVSIGSPPAVQARIAGIRAAGLCLLGLLLAFPVGVIPTVVTARTAAMTSNLGSVWSQVPWSLGTMYVLLPVAMLVVAMVASAVAQAARPVRISNSAFE